MFAKFRGDWGFRELSWYMTYDVLRNEFSQQAMNKAHRAAYRPIADFAEDASREAIEKEVEDVC